MMTDYEVLWTVRAREWQGQLLYILRVLGMDTTKFDWIAYSYGFYLLGITFLWVLVSWSGILHLGYTLGHVFPVPVVMLLPTLLTIILVIQLTGALAGLPFSLAHGDLEILAPSPVSRRAFAVYALVTKQVRSGIIWGFLGSLALSFLHLNHDGLISESLLFSLWGLTGNVWGFFLAVARVSESRTPRRGLWLLPLLLLLPLIGFREIMNWPAHWVVAPLIQSAFFTTALGFLAAFLLLGWILSWLLAVRIDFISIQEASELYADVRALGTAYLPNARLVQDMRLAARLRCRKSLGRLPEWPFPQWEVGRFFIGLVRSPRQLLALIETALLLRSGLFLVFGPPIGLSWLFWLFICYRFQRGGMTLHFQRDFGDAFIRQFWPDTTTQRLLRSTALPLALVTTFSYLFWLVIPLGVSISVFHAIFLLGLIATWHLAESIELARNVTSGGTMRSREVRTMALGIVLFTAIALHHPRLALLIPVALSGVAATKSLARSRDDSEFLPR